MSVRGSDFRKQNRSQTDVENDTETDAAREPHCCRFQLDSEAILAPQNGAKRGKHRRLKEKSLAFFGRRAGGRPGATRGPPGGAVVQKSRGAQYVFSDIDKDWGAHGARWSPGLLGRAGTAWDPVELHRALKLYILYLMCLLLF